MAKQKKESGGAVLAKFKVDGVELREKDKPEEGGTVRLSPVINGSPENENFYKWTPGGNIILSTINSAALALFQEGGEKYVLFTDEDPTKQLTAEAAVAHLKMAEERIAELERRNEELEAAVKAGEHALAEKAQMEEFKSRLKNAQELQRAAELAQQEADNARHAAEGAFKSL